MRDLIVKRFFIVLGISVFLIMTASISFAHTLYMNVLDNEDGTITIEAMFSTGTEAAGIRLYLENKKGEIIEKYKLDDAGEVTFNMPDVPYMIFLDGGPGHTVRKDGPFK